MTAVWIIAGVIALIARIDLWVKLVYRYPKRPHATTPGEFGIPFEEVRFPTRRNRQLYGWWIAAGKESAALRRA